MAGGIDLGRAYVQIVPSAEGISNSITSALSGSDVTNSISKNVSSLTAQAVGSTISNNVAKPLTNVFSTLFSKSSEYEAMMSKNQAIFGATSEEMAMMDEAIKSAASDSVYSLVETAEAMTFFGKAGWGTAESCAALAPVMQLSAATGDGLASTADILSDVMTALGDSADDVTMALDKNGFCSSVSMAAHYSDLLAAAATSSATDVAGLGEAFKYVAPAAGSLEYSFDDLVFSLGLMANSGVKGSQAGTSLRAALVNMSDPTKDVSNAMETLGVHLTDDTGNMLSLREVVEQLRQGFGEGSMSSEEFNSKLSELGEQLESGKIDQEAYDAAVQNLTVSMYGAEGAQKAALAATLAGKTGMAGLLALVNAAPEDYDSLSASIYMCNGATEEMYNIMQDNAQGAIAKLSSSLDVLATSMGETLLPVVTNLVEHLITLVNGFNNLDPGIQQVIFSFVAFGTAMGPVLQVVGNIITVIGGISPIVSTITSVVGSSGGIISGVVEAIAGGVSALFGMIAANPVIAIIAVISAAVIALGVLVFKHWDEIKAGAQAVGEWIGEKFDAAIEAIKSAWNGLKEFFVTAWESIKTVFTGVAEWFGSVFTAAKEAIGAAFSTVAETFSNIWQSIQGVFAGVGEWFGTQFTAAKEAAIRAFDGVQETFIGVWDAIQGAFGEVAEWFGERFTEAKEAALGAWDNVVETFTGVWQNIQSVFSGIADWFGTQFTAAKDAAVSAWDAVVSAFQDVWAGIQTAFNDTVNWFSDTFTAAKEGAIRAWEAATQAFQEVWQGIQGVFQNVAEWFGQKFTEAKERVATAWEGLQERFQTVRTKIEGVFNGFADWAERTSKGAMDKFAGAWNGIKSKFSTVWKSIKEAFSLKDAIQWGRDMISNFASGIASGVSAVATAAKNAAKTVSNFLHFSEPEMGPLADFHTFAPDMMRMFAEGILDGRKEVKSALNEALEFDVPTIDTPEINISSARLQTSAITAANAQQAAGNTYNFYSPKALDPVSAMREAKKQSQRLAMAF